jgi:integrase/recombinase XerD
LVPQTTPKGLLTRAECQTLAEVPPEVAWFANLGNTRTRRAYPIDLRLSWRLLAL